MSEPKPDPISWLLLALVFFCLVLKSALAILVCIAKIAGGAK